LQGVVQYPTNGRLEVTIMLIKGILAAVLAGLGVFAVVGAEADPAQTQAHGAAYQPDGGLAALLRPMEH
jgi:hypothetical protein